MLAPAHKNALKTYQENAAKKLFVICTLSFQSEEVAMLVVKKDLPSTKQFALKPSRYNLLATSVEGNLLIVNTYSGAQVMISNKDRAQAEELLSSSEIPRGAPHVEALAKCDILVPSETDELRRVLFKQHHVTSRESELQLIILPTEKCNFRCIYCYETFEKGPMSIEVRGALKKFIERRIRTLASLGIDWFGGEPLIAFNVIEDVMTYTASMAQKYECELTGHITTNAYLLTPDKAEKLLSWGVKSFQITVDGPRSEHNKRRRLYKPLPLSPCGVDSPTIAVEKDHNCNPDSYDTFDQIMKNMKDLLGLRQIFNVCLRTNYDLDSLTKMPDWIDEMVAFVGNDPRVRVDFCPIWADPDQVSVSVPVGSKRQQTYSALLKLAHSRGLQTSVLANLQFGGLVCYAAKANSFVIRSDGTLNKCTVALDTDYNQVGRLLSDGNLEIDIDKLTKWTNSGMETDHTCQNCPVSPTCQGNACPLERFENGHRPCPPVKNYPEILLPLVEQ